MERLHISAPRGGKLNENRISAVSGNISPNNSLSLSSLTSLYTQEANVVSLFDYYVTYILSFCVSNAKQCSMQLASFHALSSKSAHKQNLSIYRCEFSVFHVCARTTQTHSLCKSIRAHQYIQPTTKQMFQNTRPSIHNKRKNVLCMCARSLSRTVSLSLRVWCACLCAPRIDCSNEFRCTTTHFSPVSAVA